MFDSKEAYPNVIAGIWNEPKKKGTRNLSLTNVNDAPGSYDKKTILWVFKIQCRQK